MSAVPQAAVSGFGAPRNEWVALAMFAALSYAATYASLAFTRFGDEVASLWGANGLLVGALLLLPKARWLAWVTAAMLTQSVARVVVGDPAGDIVGLGIANLVESLLVAGWLRRGVDDLRQAASLGRLSREAALATLTAAALSGAMAIWFLGAGAYGNLLETWIVWFMAHGLGMVIIGTLVTCLAHPSVKLSGRKGHRLDYAACIGLMLAGCAVTFLQSRYPLLFVAYLPLVLLAYRHGLSGMVSGTILLAATSGLAAAADSGPFALEQGTALARVLLWQTYIAAGCLLAYATSIAVTERIRLLRRVRRHELQLHALAENLPAMVAHFDKDVRYTYANARSRAMMGDAELVGRTLAEVRGEEAYAGVARYVEGALRGEPQACEMQLEMNGREVELHAQFVPDRGPDGSVQGFYSLAFDITEQNRNKRELERLARFDPLTGLANRRHFEQSLAEAVARARRVDHPLMVLALDLDRFKQINDQYGHAAGDAVLRQFAARVREAVYDVDLVARLGGDEFVVLLEYTPTAEVGQMVAERLLASMREPIRIRDISLVVATSIGIGLHEPVESAERVLALADEALYAAKASGRNAWVMREG